MELVLMRALKSREFPGGPVKIGGLFHCSAEETGALEANGTAERAEESAKAAPAKEGVVRAAKPLKGARAAAVPTIAAPDSGDLEAATAEPAET